MKRSSSSARVSLRWRCAPSPLSEIRTPSPVGARSGGSPWRRRCGRWRPTSKDRRSWPSSRSAGIAVSGGEGTRCGPRATRRAGRARTRTSTSWSSRSDFLSAIACSRSGSGSPTRTVRCRSGAGSIAVLPRGHQPPLADPVATSTSITTFRPGPSGPTCRSKRDRPCGPETRSAASRSRSPHAEDLVIVAALHVLNDLWKGKLGLGSWRDVLVLTSALGYAPHPRRVRAVRARLALRSHGRRPRPVRSGGRRSHGRPAGTGAQVGAAPPHRDRLVGELGLHPPSACHGRPGCRSPMPPPFSSAPPSRRRSYVHDRHGIVPRVLETGALAKRSRPHGARTSG